MKILQKEITGTQTSFSANIGGKLSFILCFLFPQRLLHIFFTAPTCTTTTITLQPCALNAEFQNQFGLSKELQSHLKHFNVNFMPTKLNMIPRDLQLNYKSNGQI
jgi:hypothetical protein